ncbi:hypothetical protein KFK09_026971 [Dendrobium nobile]|uniref:Uncharacterized protein n=1 Tax=Dendrobium nobile TaxID=94219 RepID=A0A8T3AEH6_DENNO|nr:hypothetical protein KFK09_026971 [Dendrobium nobile]
MVHSRNNRCAKNRESFPGLTVRVVEVRCKGGIDRLLPPSTAVCGAVDYENIPRRKNQHVAHQSRPRHLFHYPLWFLISYDHATAGAEGLVVPSPESCTVCPGGCAATYHDFNALEKVVAGSAAGETRERAENGVVAVVKEDGVAIGEDEEIAIRGKVDEGVEIVSFVTALAGLAEEGQLVCSFIGVGFRDELVGEDVEAAEDEDAVGAC